MDPSDLHEKDLGCDSQTRLAIRDEIGAESTHYACGLREINVIPCKNLSLKLSNQQLRIAIRLRLGSLKKMRTA